MKIVEHDPFGEADLQSRKEYASGSRLMQRFGVFLFWVLVAAIVVTRATYFDPAFADHWQYVASLAHSLIAWV